LIHLDRIEHGYGKSKVARLMVGSDMPVLTPEYLPQASRPDGTGIPALATLGWENVMARNKERDELEQHITQLKASLNKPGLSADTRVTGLAALVHARAMTLAADALDAADRDVISPLVSALLGFGEQAEMLSVRLGQLPE